MSREHSAANAVLAERWRQRPVSQRTTGALLSFCRQKPLGAIGGFLIVGLVLTAIFADIVSPYDPLLISRPDQLAAPSARYWLGADHLGRDLLSRIIHGSRTSLYVGILAILLGTLSGTSLGVVSAYFGGKVDLLVQRVMDSMMAFPMLILAMAVVAMLGPSLNNIILTLAIVLTPGNSRVVRGAVLSVKENPYIDAARALGARDLRIILRHILPNVMAPIIVLVSIQLGGAILVEASLSFLGLGPPPPTPTWGGMLSGTGRQFMESAPWMAIFPGLAISLAVLGFNLLGDALRDVLDPRMRGSR